MGQKCRLLIAKDGNKVPFLESDGGEIRFGSLYNGSYAAGRWLQYHIAEEIENVVLFGLGDGQILRGLLERIPGSVFVYEPSEALYREMRHTAICKKLQVEKRVRIFSGKQSFTELCVALWELLNENYVDTTAFRIHSGYGICYPGEIERLQGQFTEMIQRINSLRPSVKRFIHSMIRNQLATVANMEGDIPLGRLAKYWNKEVPVIVISAGPSLEKNLQWLKEVNGRAFLFSVDAALPLLLENDIIPDLVACLDANKNMNCFADERSLSIPLLVTTNAPAGLIRNHRAKKIWGSTHAFMNALYTRCGIELPETEVELGVATLILASLIDLGTRKIIFVGQDLAYSKDGKSHISGREEKFIKNKKYETEGYDGGKVFSRADWTMTREWMEKEIHRAKDREFINATEGGAKIKGTRQKTLEEVVGELKVQDISFQEILDDNRVCIRPEEYEKLKKEFLQGKEDLNKVRKEGYEKTFFETDYKKLPVMNLVTDYMASLEEKPRKVRFEKAVDYVYNEYDKEITAWKH
ncbi:MAG: motility associated factor glycosyltransferase family protein [Lachnospiraceae bacterium]|nr:motility associated factor glycosyltransferase family protein [Lachnospiraceae bacterium]